MTTKEFIARIADGTYSKNDVIMQSAQFPDKEDLLCDLELADKACLESTGKPQITDEVQINRIAKAISILSEEYRISLVDTDSHRVATSIKIPGELDTDLFRAFLNVAIQRGIIEKHNDSIKFNGSKALLSFACGVIFCGDYIGKDTLTKYPVVKRGHKAQFPQTSINELFGTKRIMQSRNQFIDSNKKNVREQKSPPKGYEDILSIIDKANEFLKEDA